MSASEKIVACDPPPRADHDISQRGSFIRQLVRSISLEDIICDDEVCDILSDYEQDYEDSFSAHTQQDDNNDAPQHYTLFPTKPHLPHLIQPQQIQQLKQAPGYTIDHNTGVASPIKITSNIGAGKGKEFNLHNSRDTGLEDIFAHHLSIANHSSLFQGGSNWSNILISPTERSNLLSSRESRHASQSTARGPNAQNKHRGIIAPPHSRAAEPVEVGDPSDVPPDSVPFSLGLGSIFDQKSSIAEPQLHQVASDPEHHLNRLEAQLGNVGISSYFTHQPGQIYQQSHGSKNEEVKLQGQELHHYHYSDKQSYQLIQQYRQPENQNQSLPFPHSHILSSQQASQHSQQPFSQRPPQPHQAHQLYASQQHYHQSQNTHLQVQNTPPIPPHVNQSQASSHYPARQYPSYSSNGYTWPVGGAEPLPFNARGAQPFQYPSSHSPPTAPLPAPLSSAPPSHSSIRSSHPMFIQQLQSASSNPGGKMHASSASFKPMSYINEAVPFPSSQKMIPVQDVFIAPHQSMQQKPIPHHQQQQQQHQHQQLLQQQQQIQLQQQLHYQQQKQRQFSSTSSLPQHAVPLLPPTYVNTTTPITAPSMMPEPNNNRMIPSTLSIAGSNTTTIQNGRPSQSSNLSHAHAVLSHSQPLYSHHQQQPIPQPILTQTTTTTTTTTTNTAFYGKDSDYNRGLGEFSSGEDMPPDDLDESGRAKRSELVESPTTKQTYKQFFKQFKGKEKDGLNSAKDFAEQNLKQLPVKVHWKVYLELADLAKRENCLKLARKFYRKVIQLQPYASQGWLEYAKMEEECGQLDRCAEILSAGLSYCPYNESLMVKGIKHEERMGNLAAARSLLSRLRTQSIDKAWRTIMEGGLLEARAGNVAVARKIFKYLIKNVPWYGPIYQEAYRFEEKCEEYDRAIAIVEKGLKENPRYGPLWFSALRLYEKTSRGNLQNARSIVERASQSISKELLWKIYFEAAQIEERSGCLGLARAAYVKSVEHCPENLLWKVWLGGSRTELNNDNVGVARKLLARALKEVPTKMRAMVLLECSRLEEYAGNVDKARKILTKAKNDAKHEWKVFLESVLLEMRANNIHGAIKAAKEALCIHSGTGRLWAVLIQLKQSKGIASQLKVFQRALREVPKSGEVWCEGARIALSTNETAEARRFLEFAIQFTPQYGDSFIEYLRLELMQHGFAADTTKLEQACVNADPNYGTMWLHCKKHPLDSTRQVLRNAKTMLIETSSKECGDGEEGPDDSDRKGMEKKWGSLLKYCDGGRHTDGAEEAEDLELDMEGLPEQECRDPRDKSRKEYNHRRPAHLSSDEEDNDEDSEGLEDNISSLSTGSASAPASPLLSDSPSCSPPSGVGALMVGGYGVLSLHRVYRVCSGLQSTERKKLIFGSDLIKP